MLNRSTKQMKRSTIARRTRLRARVPFRATAPLQCKPRKPTPAKPKKPINKRGRRTKAWSKVWRWLKPRLEKAGRTSCEFDFLEHNCSGPLDPAHSKKREEMQGLDIYAVALGCRTIHNYLDGVHVYPPLGRRFTHAEMEEAVMKAINRHGGMIVP